MCRTLLHVLISLSFFQTAYGQVKKTVAKPPVRQASLPFANIKDDPSPIKYIQLKKDTPVYVPKLFYIQKVENNAGSNDSVGFFLQPKSGNKQKVAFATGAAQGIEEYLNFKIAKDTTLYPLIFSINSLSLSETKDNDYRKGTYTYDFSFKYNTKDKPLILGAYNGTYSYTVHITQKRILDSIIAKSLLINISDIEKTLGEAIEQHLAFCKGVTTAINYRMVNNMASDTIFFDDRQDLTWDDFAAPTTGGDNYFLPYIELLFSPQMEYKDGKVKLDINTGAYFIKSRSWAGKKLINAQMLRHLQYRFKLAWLASVKLKAKIETATFTCEHYQEELRDMVMEVTKELQKVTEDYSTQTVLGTNKMQQVKWQHDIDTAIDATKK